MRGPFQSPNFRGNYADSTSRQAFFFLWFITSKSTVSSASNLINLMNVLALQPKLKKKVFVTLFLSLFKLHASLPMIKTSFCNQKKIIQFYLSRFSNPQIDDFQLHNGFIWPKQKSLLWVFDILLRTILRYMM